MSSAIMFRNFIIAHIVNFCNRFPLNFFNKKEARFLKAYKGIVFHLANQMQDMIAESGCTVKEARIALRMLKRRLRGSKTVQPSGRKKL